MIVKDRRKIDILEKSGYFLLLIGLAIHVYLVIQYNFTQDDAYITFRYARNFLNGDGLVYNTGERIEGYTNFLWTIFMIIGRQAGLGFVTFSKILGTAFGLATIILSYLMGRLIFRYSSGWRKPILPGVCCLLLSACYSFNYWTVAGLETAAFGFTVLLAIYTYIRRSSLLIPVLVIGTLLRPEGGLIFVFIAIYEIVSNRSWNRYLQNIIFFYILYLLPLLFFKVFYYGSVLPNPFYAKTSFTIQQVIDGMDYLWLYLRHYLGFGLFVIPALMAFKTGSAKFRLCMVLLLIYTIYIVLIGGDVLKVHRFFVPIIPIIIIAVVYGIDRLVPKNYLLVPIILVVIVSQLVLPRKHVSEFHSNEIALTTKMSGMLDRLLAIDQTDFSLATSTIGMVGYRLMGHTVIDLLGLTDSTIARHPEPPIAGMETSWRESHFNSRYVLTRQPDYIMFSTGFKPSAPAERSLFLHTSFLRSYRAIPFYKDNRPHSIFKRYLPVGDEVVHDVDVRFVQNLAGGIVLLNKDRNLPEALARFNLAREYLPDTTYPYVYYYLAITYGQMLMFDSTIALLEKMVSVDTLTYEGFFGLGQQACADRDREKFLAYRARIAKLVPWMVPRLDSICLEFLRP
jgi:hypothetical protein